MREKWKKDIIDFLNEAGITEFHFDNHRVTVNDIRFDAKVLYCLAKEKRKNAIPYLRHLLRR